VNMQPNAVAVPPGGNLGASRALSEDMELLNIRLSATSTVVAPIAALLVVTREKAALIAARVGNTARLAEMRGLSAAVMSNLGVYTRNIGVLSYYSYRT
jgi:hypothetical protein